MYRFLRTCIQIGNFEKDHTTEHDYMIPCEGEEQTLYCCPGSQEHHMQLTLVKCSVSGCTKRPLKTAFSDLKVVETLTY